MKAVLYTYASDDPLGKFAVDFPELDWAVVRSPQEMGREAADADIIVLANRVCTPELGAAIRGNASPALRWMHFLTAGLDRGIAMGLPAGVLVSNATGVKAPVVAEHAVTLLLAVARRIPEIHSNQLAHRWLRDETSPRMRSLDGMTVCIVGLGNIGREIARKLAAFNVTSIGVSRAGKAEGEVAAVYPRERLAEAAAQSDAIIVATSADEDSIRLVGATTFRAMKRGGLLVNIARGPIIDEPALIAALESGEVGGAGLDVQMREPLPADSPLWDMPNVIVSPHVAGTGSSDYDAQKALFAKNLERFKTARPLINQCQIPVQTP